MYSLRSTVGTWKLTYCLMCTAVSSAPTEFRPIPWSPGDVRQKSDLMLFLEQCLSVIARVHASIVLCQR